AASRRRRTFLHPLVGERVRISRGSDLGHPAALIGRVRRAEDASPHLPPTRTAGKRYRGPAGRGPKPARADVESAGEGIVIDHDTALARPIVAVDGDRAVVENLADAEGLAEEDGRIAEAVLGVHVPDMDFIGHAVGRP